MVAPPQYSGKLPEGGPGRKDKLRGVWGVLIGGGMAITPSLTSDQPHPLYPPLLTRRGGRCYKEGLRPS